MKKLITLLLLFTITLFYSIPTQAYTLDGNDIPLVQTKNLFNKNDPNNTYNRYVNSATGNLSTLATYYASDYITIQPNRTYIQSGQTGSYEQAFYTSNFVYISGNATTSFTTPSNAKYVRVSVIETILNSYQLELGATATSYANYGFLTLNDIFLDGQLIINNNFDDGFNTWTNDYPTIITVSNGIVNFNINNEIGFIEKTFSAFNFTTYAITRLKKNSGTNFRIDLSTSNKFLITETEFNNANNQYNLYSKIFTSSDNINRVFIGRGNSQTHNTDVDYVKLYNLTSLGIDTLDKSQIDIYYNLWELNNAYIKGFTDGYTDGFNDGFNDGYDEGFDDGVASDTSFAVGYALGLSQGEDMETGSSLLILIVALIGFVMMIFGFTTKRGIFNLLSVAAFVVLGGLLIEFVGFIIITFGLVLINIYYAFFGDL
jgi:hypothetical protein